jgi:membrane protein DedA with SNARE-associated domain
MNLGNPGAFAAIYVAAAVEGEIVFVAAAVLVATGAMSPAIVLTAGALGAATGDQFFFYALRGNARRWAARIPGLASRRETIVERVRRHQIWMILAVRFAPGLRIAIAAACALAGVPALRFSVLNTVSAFVWAALVLALVARAGPAAVQHLGFGGVWGAVICGGLFLLFGWWIGRRAS